MRYKANFGPSYLLDPESLEWNLFDNEYRKKLDQRRYVSLSYDQTNAQEGPESSNAINAGSITDASVTDATKPNDTTKERAQKFADDKDLELDEAASDEEDAEIPEGSLFDYGVPGVLKKEEVEKLDLDHWRLVVRNTLIELEDLRGWEDWKIDDPGSIKGIAAEVIAATGPKLLQNSSLVLF